MSEPPPSGRREQKKRDKRDRVRRAAWELFVRQGYEATTTRAIAERAGIASGTLFLYAKDKADLLFLVFEHRLGECVREGLRTLPADVPFVDRLMHLFRKLFAMYGEAPEVGRMFVKEFPGATGPNADRVHAITARFLSDVAGLVERAQERGEIRGDVAPMAVAQTAFGLYFVALMGWLTGMIPRDYAIGGQLEQSLGLLFDGLRSR